MTAELDKLAAYKLSIGDEVGAAVFRHLAGRERLVGTPEVLSPEIDGRIEALGLVRVKELLSIAADRFVNFGFAQKLGVRSEDLWDRIYNLAEAQPEAYKGRFDIPVINFGDTIPIKEQYEMIGFDASRLEGLRIKDHPVHHVPSTLTLVWMNDGIQNSGRSVASANENLAPDERGATLYDGVGLMVADIDILDNQFIDLPGTSLIKELREQGREIHAPNLRTRRGDYIVDHFEQKAPIESYGSATCAR